MTCLSCLSAGMQPADFGSPRRCAFESPEFSPENWNCATLSALRDQAIFRHRDDQENGSICIIPLPLNDIQQGYIVLSFYKDRGSVGRAIVMHDGEDPKVLTLQVAEVCLGVTA